MFTRVSKSFVKLSGVRECLALNESAKVCAKFGYKICLFIYLIER